MDAMRCEVGSCRQGDTIGHLDVTQYNSDMEGWMGTEGGAEERTEGEDRKEEERTIKKAV